MSELIIRDVFRSIDKDINPVKKLLKSEGLKLDPFVDKTVAMFDEDVLVATGSVAGNTIRSLCVHSDYRGTSAINKLMTYLIKYLYERGKQHIFIYTKPDYSESFEYMGFSTLIKTDNVVLLDSRRKGIYEYLDEIKIEREANPVIGSIVMNGNPFTLGHKYLVEKALEACAEVYLFVVWEQKSLFPNDVRFRLIKEGLKEYKNVHVVEGRDYIISSATFPTYFLKENDDSVDEHAKLDLTLYRDFIAPYLGITKRYVGEEKLCDTTRKYNEVMKDLMEGSSLEIVEIPRKENGNKIISASYVREYIRDDKWELVKAIVPESTYDFLKSEEAKSIIKKIKDFNTRH